MVRAVAEFDPDLVICPFLRERVPAEVWRHRRTIIIHPGPKGDRGPSSLDWAITDGRGRVGRDGAAGRRGDGRRADLGHPHVPVDAAPPRKSSLYNGPVADAAIELIREVVVKAADPAFVPGALGRPPARRRRPAATADAPVGPGVLVVGPDRAGAAPHPRRRRVTRRAHDACAASPCRCSTPTPDRPRAGEPGTVVARRHGAVLVRTGDGGDLGRPRRGGCPATANGR